MLRVRGARLGAGLPDPGFALVEDSLPRYGGRHVLVTNLEPPNPTNIPDPFHPSPSRDPFTPLAPDGTPLLLNAWRYLLGGFDPPVIDPHEDVVANADSRAGVVVTYSAPGASDALDGAVSVLCQPASGSVFPRGATTVSCTAGDAHGNVGTSSFSVTVLDFRQQLLALREQAVALPGLEGQAEVRLRSAVEFLDKFLAALGWDADGSPATNDAGMNAIRNGRSALNYLRTPSATLAGASAAIQLGLAELMGRIAQARLDEVDGTAGANGSRVSQAHAHFNLGAGYMSASPPNLGEAYLQFQKVCEVVKNEPPAFGSAPAAA